MKYSNELCRLVANNIEILEEAPSVLSDIESKMFKAMNKRIKERIENAGDWKGVYDYYTNDKYNETSFAPLSWPNNAEENYAAFFTLSLFDEEDSYWVSVFFGLKNSSMCFNVGFDANYFSLTDSELKVKVNEFFANHNELSQRGFRLIYPTSKYCRLSRGFSFDRNKFIEELPAWDETFDPLDKALDDVLASVPLIEKFIDELKN
ncbi:hypothetical protein [Maridesulfovibrio sp.]|uniref:hypothetical protein n=1 Tax=Maridesulfovibrio sp. TaxID=2795000 RepID=UPI002AA8CDB6|nr:hypothetical protein [Maridesulfovibrio sp.]